MHSPHVKDLSRAMKKDLAREGITSGAEPVCCGAYRAVALIAAAVIAIAATTFVLRSGPQPPPGASALITSEPAGATVFVNGRLAGSTPLIVNGLSLGDYGLRFEKAGFQPLN